MVKDGPALTGWKTARMPCHMFGNAMSRSRLALQTEPNDAAPHLLTANAMLPTHIFTVSVAARAAVSRPQQHLAGHASGACRWRFWESRRPHPRRQSRTCAQALCACPDHLVPMQQGWLGLDVVLAPLASGKPLPARRILDAGRRRRPPPQCFHGTTNNLRSRWGQCSHLLILTGVSCVFQFVDTAGGAHL